MASEIIPISSKGQMVQEYTAEWRLLKLSHMETKGMQTPVFYPIPEVDLKFYFEVFYQKIFSDSRRAYVSYLKLTLVKICDSWIPPDLKLKIEVEVFYTNNCIYKDSRSSEAILVNTMKPVTCIEGISDFYDYESNNYTIHDKNMKSDSLILKCTLLFFDHLSTTLEYCRERHTLNNFLSFAKNFSSIGDEPCVLSDISLTVENETFPAHKSVLAAHSSVFMKMLLNDYLESKTNTITIPNCSLNIFKCFLAYFYCGTLIDKSFPVLKDLYVVADAYDVKTLKKECSAEMVHSHLNLGKVCDILKIAFDFDDEYLQYETKRFAACNMKQILSKPEWKILMKTHLHIGYETLVFSHLSS